MRTELRSTAGHGTVRGRRWRARFAVFTVVISSTLGVTLLPQPASSQTVIGSAIALRPNGVRQAGRHRAPQVAKDVVVDTANALPRQLPAPNSQLPNRRLSGSSLTSALQDGRFGEGAIGGGMCVPWGCGENSPVIEGATVVAPSNAARPARRHQLRQLVTKDAVVDDANIQPSQLPTPNHQLPKRRLVASSLTTALHQARFGEATIRGGGCVPWGCGENSPVVEGAVVVAPSTGSHPARRHQAPQLTTKDVAIGDVNLPSRVKPSAIDARKAMNAGARTSLQDARFAEAFGRNLNSSVVDGAAIAVLGQVRPARRHRAHQVTAKDVAVEEASESTRQLPTLHSQLPNRRLAASSLTLALQEARFGEATIRGGTCLPWGCGENSPVVEGAMADEERASRSFHELNLHGVPNSAGFVVAGVRKGATRYSLEVNGSSVTAHPRSGTGLRLTGAALVGLVLDLRDATGERYDLQFAAAGATAYWAGSSDIVPTYTLTYTSAVHQVAQPLCTAGVNEAILFAGDRYDAARKTVIATGEATRGWVNIACAATALAKLFLVRHSEASQEVATTREERQAMLKMFTADVCGDGTSFTVHGQPLFWADAKGITRFPDAPRTLEAVWNETGAVCMDQPRRPEFADAITAHCGPRPRCTPRSRGHVVSANP